MLIKWYKLFANKTCCRSERQRVWMDAYIYTIKTKNKMKDWTMTACYLSFTRIKLNNLLLYSHLSSSLLQKQPIIMYVCVHLSFRNIHPSLRKKTHFSSSSFFHDLCDLMWNLLAKRKHWINFMINHHFYFDKNKMN